MSDACAGNGENTPAPENPGSALWHAFDQVGSLVMVVGNEQDKIAWQGICDWAKPESFDREDPDAGA